MLWNDRSDYCLIDVEWLQRVYLPTMRLVWIYLFSLDTAPCIQYPDSLLHGGLLDIDLRCFKDLVQFNPIRNEVNFGDVVSWAGRHLRNQLVALHVDRKRVNAEVFTHGIFILIQPKL